MRLDALLDEPRCPPPSRWRAPTRRDVEVTDVVLDTRERRARARSSAASPGSRVDGHDLAGDAVAAGAVAVLAERRRRRSPPASPRCSVPVGPRRDGPARRGAPRATRRATLTVVGVTGTNGKTTTTHLLRSVFEASGQAAEVIGTLTGTPGAPPTTPEAPELQARLAGAARRAASTAVAMEVSSHGLAMHRVDGTRFAAAGVHQPQPGPPRLPRHDGGLLRGQGPPVRRRRSPTSPSSTSTTRTAGCCATPPPSAPSATRSTTPSDLELRRRRLDVALAGRRRCTLPLAGRFNVAQRPRRGHRRRRARRRRRPTSPPASPPPPPVPGRFEPVDAGQPFAVVVDYAHTPDGLEQRARRRPASSSRPAAGWSSCSAAAATATAASGRAWARSAARLADRVVVTSDNPRSEDPAAIIDDDPRRHRRPAPTVVVEPDRRAAIAAGRRRGPAGRRRRHRRQGPRDDPDHRRPTSSPFDDARSRREALCRRRRLRTGPMIGLLLAAGTSLLVALVGTRFLIDWLRGRRHRPADPRGRARRATPPRRARPTMGGVVIVVGAVARLPRRPPPRGRDLHPVRASSPIARHRRRRRRRARSTTGSRCSRERNLGLSKRREDGRAARSSPSASRCCAAYHTPVHFTLVVHPLRLPRHRHRPRAAWIVLDDAS